MALTLQTKVSGDVFVLHCDGRIVFGDEGAALRERVRNLLKGSPKIVVNLASVEHIDSEGLGILVGLFTSARNRGGELKLVSPNNHVQSALHRTTLDRVFAVYANDDEAVAAFREHVA
jgi:anti-sigma B factor antagonist